MCLQRSSFVRLASNGGKGGKSSNVLQPNDARIWNISSQRPQARYKLKFDIFLLLIKWTVCPRILVDGKDGDFKAKMVVNDNVKPAVRLKFYAKLYDVSRELLHDVPCCRHVTEQRRIFPILFRRCCIQKYLETVVKIHNYKLWKSNSCSAYKASVLSFEVKAMDKGLMYLSVERDLMLEWLKSRRVVIPTTYLPLKKI